MQPVEVFMLSTPIGMVEVSLTQSNLVHIQFSPFKTEKPINPNSAFGKTAAAALQGYFSNPKFTLDIPVVLKGTPLQIKVWQFLKTIPAGETMTYSEIANVFHTHPRVIGNICRANPIPLVIPCHRVVAKHSRGGFCGKTAGDYVRAKQWLLNHEGIS